MSGGNEKPASGVSRGAAGGNVDAGRMTDVGPLGVRPGLGGGLDERRFERRFELQTSGSEWFGTAASRRRPDSSRARADIKSRFCQLVVMVGRSGQATRHGSNVPRCHSRISSAASSPERSSTIA